MRGSWYFGSTTAAKRGPVRDHIDFGRVSQGLIYSLAMARQAARNRLVNGPVEDGGGLAHVVGEGDEFLGEEGLHAIGEGFLRLGMNFNGEAISANGDSGSGGRRRFVAVAGARGGLDDR